MSTPTVNVNFGDMPESKAVRYLKEAGVHRGGSFMGMKSDTLEKKDKEGKVEASWKYWEFQFDLPKGEFAHNYFEFTTDPSKVTYFPDHYENGVKTRKKTAEEVVNANFQTLFFFLTQLAVAQGYPFVMVRSVLNAAVQQGGDGFQNMMLAFQKNFPAKKEVKIDVKVLWNNNDKKKTSFLRIPDPGARNVVFGMHLPQQETVFLSPNEEKVGGYFSLHRKFAPPAKGTTEAGGASATDSVDNIPDSPGISAAGSQMPQGLSSENLF